MNQTATFTTKDFQQLVADVTRFPSAGAFADSENVGLSVKEGKATAYMHGMVLTKVRVPAEGDLATLGVDERLLESFASICSATSVTITRDGDNLLLKCGKKQVTAAVAKTQKHPIPGIAGIAPIEITQEMASRIGYLANIAYNDSSRPELCCVMLTADGRAVAIDQKAIAVLACGGKRPKPVALPLTLAKALVKGATLFPAPNETVLRIGSAYHCMPAPIAAQNDFPISIIDGYEKRKAVFECTGAHLAAAITDCTKCVSSVARTETLLTMTTTEKGLSLVAENGGAIFRTTVKGVCKSVDVTAVVPLERANSAVAFLDTETKVLSQTGTKGETFFAFGSGWIVFPAFNK